MTLENGPALTIDDPDAVARKSDHDLRHTMDEVEALKICQKRFTETHSRYHTERREQAATVYAIALRLLHNEPAQIRLLSEPMFRQHRSGKFETARDLFRVTWVYVTNEDPEAREQVRENYGALVRSQGPPRECRRRHSEVRRHRKGRALRPLYRAVCGPS